MGFWTQCGNLSIFCCYLEFYVKSIVLPSQSFPNIFFWFFLEEVNSGKCQYQMIVFFNSCLSLSILPPLLHLHCVEITEFNSQNIFHKNSVKSMLPFFLNHVLCLNKFHEIIFKWEEISEIFTLWFHSWKSTQASFQIAKLWPYFYYTFHSFDG